jgi:hypothetical protein
MSGVGYDPNLRRPPTACQHNPCWCGRPVRHQLGEDDAQETAKWLADREAARNAAAHKAKP